MDLGIQADGVTSLDNNVNIYGGNLYGEIAPNLNAYLVVAGNKDKAVQKMSQW